MEYVIAAALLIFSLLGAVLIGLLKDEASAWLPKLIAHILTIAVQRAPEDRRSQYAEEWSSHIADVPGKLSQLFLALAFYKVAFKTARLSRAKRFQYTHQSIVIVNHVFGIGTAAGAMLGAYYGHWTLHAVFVGLCAAGAVGAGFHRYYLERRVEQLAIELANKIAANQDQT